MPGLQLRHLAPIWLCVACFQDGPVSETGSTGTTGTTGTTSTTGSTGGSSESTGAPTTGAASTGSTGGATDTGEATDTDTGEATDTGTGSSTGPMCMTPWYRDVDDDGHGDPDVVQFACMPPDGHVALGDDCDDMDAARAPGLDELCDDKDNDCDALIDEHSPQNVLCKQCTLFARAGHSYAFCTFARSWPAARDECKKRSGDLAVIDDADENAAIAAQGAVTPGTIGAWYIGLSDLALEGTFVWLDGIPPAFVSWNVGEPNDAGMAEDCTMLPNATGLWNDQGCDPPGHFLCETPAP